MSSSETGPRPPVPANSSPARPPKPLRTWSQRAFQAFAVAVTLSVTGGMVAYSAMLTFDAPRPMRTRGFEDDSATQVFLTGQIEGHELNLRVVQADAIVLLFPTAPASTLRDLPDVAGLLGRDVPKDIGCLQTDVDGVFRFTRTAYEAFQPGEHFLLVISQSRLRTDPPPRADLETLERHFQDPQRLLGKRQYRLDRITMTGEEPLTHDVYFADAAARPALKIEE